MNQIENPDEMFRTNPEEFYADELRDIGISIESNNLIQFNIAYEKMSKKIRQNENCKFTRTKGIYCLEKFVFEIFKRNPDISNEIIDVITGICKNIAFKIVEYYGLVNPENNLQQGKLNNFRYLHHIFQTNNFNTIGIIFLIEKLIREIELAENYICIEIVLTHVLNNTYLTFEQKTDIYNYVFNLVSNKNSKVCVEFTEWLKNTQVNLMT